jgi:hypothetical protein
MPAHPIDLNRLGAVAPRIHLNVRSDGTTYVENDPDEHTLTPYCRKCQAWRGEVVTYDPAAKSGPHNIRTALLLTNKSTVWHRVEHGGPVPVPFGT